MSKTWYLVAAVAAAMVLPVGASAQGNKDAVVVGMVLEPPGLDPTTGAAAAIGEIVHYNLFEGLTKITQNGSVAPLLAESWTVTPDAKVYTFKLLKGVKFHNGNAFTSADVKDTFERDGAEKSLNKRKAIFANMAKIDTPDPSTVVITLKEPNPQLPFSLGENTAVILDPSTAANDATQPIGTGPFKFENWVKGSSVTLVKASTYRDPAAIKLNKVTFKFIADPSAQVAAMLAGDVDALPTFASPENVKQFQADPRFTVTVGTTEGETILAMNNKRKPFDDIRVRRAISYAIDRKAIIDGAMYGFGTPIGSHFAPHQPAYIDLTGVYPHDPEKAKALLKEAGFANGLEMTLKLPPPAYARRGGEIIAAQLAKVGIKAKIENVEWAAWLSGVYKNKDFDLTIVSHVEPLDISIYANPDYYFQYDSKDFRDIMAKADAALDVKERTKYYQEAQRKLAEDAPNAFLFELAKISIAKKGLVGLWTNAPIFANDMTAVHWQ